MQKSIPYTIAFGTLRSQTFRYAGKTTVLRHLLQNAAGLKFGCVINDVASVNVDAKLVRNDRNRGGQTADAATTTSDLADTVELSNGCACEPCVCCCCHHWPAVGVQHVRMCGAKDTLKARHLLPSMAASPAACLVVLCR